MVAKEDDSVSSQTQLTSPYFWRQHSATQECLHGIDHTCPAHLHMPTLYMATASELIVAQRFMHSDNAVELSSGGRHQLRVNVEIYRRGKKPRRTVTHHDVYAARMI